LEAIVPTLAVPVQPLLEGSTRPYAMFKDYWKYQWVLEVYRYNGLEELLISLKEHVIEPAERKAKELVTLRAQEFEAHAPFGGLLLACLVYIFGLIDSHDRVSSMIRR
jgi:hypothetical protein